MTNEKITAILQDTSALEQVTYEELKTLVLAYPYAHNLRLLLAIKSKQIDHKDSEANLHMASTYALDRKHLYQLMTSPVLVAEPQQEQMLELKPIAKLQESLASYVPMDRISNTKEQSNTMQTMTPVIKNNHTTTPPYVTTEQEEPTLFVEQEETIPMRDTTISINEESIAEHFPLRKKRENSNFFGQWAQQFILPVLEQQLGAVSTQPAATNIQVTSEQQIQPTPLQDTPSVSAPSKSVSAESLAQRSLMEDKSMASETLAMLYAKQGLNLRAIEMYERLILANPEKTAFFAAQIEKIR
jgi:hypothetical protein